MKPKPIDTTECLKAARAGYVSVTAQWLHVLPPFPFTAMNLNTQNGTRLEFIGGGSASVLVGPDETPEHCAWVYGRQLALRRIRDDVREQEAKVERIVK